VWPSKNVENRRRLRTLTAWGGQVGAAVDWHHTACSRPRVTDRSNLVTIARGSMHGFTAPVRMWRLAGLLRILSRGF
jgi:hypothetical protein